MEENAKEKLYHPKPLLTVDEQIAHLKAKGVTFDLCGEGEARSYLQGKCRFFRTSAYRKLFPKYEGGSHDGEYIALDFGQLKYLAGLDQRLRETLLPMTLDIEHFSRDRLIALASANGEDGYGIMSDFLASSASQRRYIENLLDSRKNDAYSGAIIESYGEALPVQAFVEVVPFGTFIGLVKFCAERWGDDGLLDSHYMLKKTKSVRNGAAHLHLILNDVNGESRPRERIRPVVSQAIAASGVPKRLRSKKLGNPKMAQIATLLYQYSIEVPEGHTKERRKGGLADLFAYADDNAGIVPEANPAMSSLAFVRRLTKAFNLLD